MNKRVLAVLLIAVSCLFFVGCGKTKNPLVGKWSQDSFVYTFNADMTCTYDAAGTLMKGTYKVDGNKLSILYEGFDVSLDTTFSVDGDKLNIKDSLGEDTIYTRLYK